MASSNQKQSPSKYGFHSTDAATLGLIESLQKLVESRAPKEYMTYDELLFTLRRWWCQYYKRPYKDPLLDEYTFEELAFEYFDITTKDNKEAAEATSSKEIPQEEYDWAAEEEARELEEAAALVAQDAVVESDKIVEEAIGLPDDQWASKYEDKSLVNPSSDDVDEGGDITATFGE